MFLVTALLCTYCWLLSVSVCGFLEAKSGPRSMALFELRLGSDEVNVVECLNGPDLRAATGCVYRSFGRGQGINGKQSPDGLSHSSNSLRTASASNRRSVL